MDVLRLLQSKNRCLQRFLDISTEFLRSAQAGEFSGLESFHAQREATLKALELYDRKISETVSQLATAERTPALVQSVRALMARREELVQAILSTDDRIIPLIEQKKSAILGEINASHKAKEMVRKFKSGWVAESGEELDRKL